MKDQPTSCLQKNQGKLANIKSSMCRFMSELKSKKKKKKREA
jgi:hypothetical protein